jgi:hypothetical protein
VLKDNGTFVLTFGQRNFMEKLPFTQFDFTLYNTDEMEETVSKAISKNENLRKRRRGKKQNRKRNNNKKLYSFNHKKIK